MGSGWKSVALTCVAATAFGFTGAAGALVVFHDEFKGAKGAQGSAGPTGPQGPVGDSTVLVQHIADLEAKVGDGSIDLTTLGCSSVLGGVDVVTGVSLIPTASTIDPYILNVQRSTICVDH